MFTNKKKTPENKFKIENRNFRNELLELKQSKHINNEAIFYTKEFIDSIKEKDPPHKFSLVSTPKKVYDVTDDYLEHSFNTGGKRQQPTMCMPSRTRNYDITESFYLKFEKNNSQNISETNDDENGILKNDDTIDVDDEYLHNMIEHLKTVKKNTTVYDDNSHKKEFDKQFLSAHLTEGNIIKNPRYVNVIDESKFNVIPHVCYTTWHTKNLPPLMKDNYDSLCNRNTDITFHLFDEEECDEFIKTHFPEDVVYAYNMLSPSSYKSDLWRYCVLYINGGIYIDIKYNTINDFKLKYLCNREHFVLDHCGKTLDSNWNNCEYGIYTALIVTKPKNIILKNCIDEIVKNVGIFFYGKNALYPTGPGLLGSKYFELKFDNNMDFIKELKLFHHELSNVIIYNNTPIIDLYKEYRVEQTANQSNLHYSKLWSLNSIYNMRYNIIQKKIVKKSEDSLTSVLCIVHIGSYHIFLKMKVYIDNLIKASYDDYDITFYFNIIDTIQSQHIIHLKQMYPSENFIVSCNYGFDIGSFFHILQIIKENNETYDYMIKLHTKTHDGMRNELIEPLLGNISNIRNTMELFRSRTNIGIIASKKSRCIDAHSDFMRNKHYLQQLLSWYFNENTTIIKQVYCTGTIFWMRFDIMKQLFFKYDIKNIINSMNNEYTFDYNWYYHSNKDKLGKTPFDKNGLYKHYIDNHKKMNLSGNLFHALKHKTNSENIRDGMIEHSYERFFGYANHRYGFKILFIE